MNDFEIVLETFRNKRLNRPLDIDPNEWRQVDWACRFAIETIENMDIKETCKWRAWDDSNWQSECKLSWMIDNDSDDPHNYIKYCPKCGKIAEIETYIEDDEE